MQRKLLLLLWIWGIGCAFVQAENSYDPFIIKQEGKYTLKNSLYHYIDKSNQVDLFSIKKQLFTPLKDEILNAGYSSSNHWVHFRVKNAQSKPLTLFVEINNPRLNHLNIYEFRHDSLVNQVLTGDALPFESRIFPNKNFAYPFTLQANEETSFYIMAEKRHEVLVFKTFLWDAKDFEKNDRESYALWGILGGITLFIFLINVILSFASRDTIYVWYMVFLLTVVVHILGQSGLGFQYFWNNSPEFNKFDPQVLFTWLLMVSNLHFMQKFIRQSASNSKIYPYLKVYKIIVLVTFVLDVIVRIINIPALETSLFKITFNLTLLFTLVSVGFAFASLFERIRKREREVLFFTFTFSIQLIGYIIVFAVNLAYTRAGEPLVKIDSYYIMVGTFLIDLILLSLGLTYFRYSDYRQQNEALLITLHETEQEQSNRTIEALEIERNRIAEDLYDDVGAMLSTAINYIASSLRNAEIREKFPVLIQARKLLNTAIENLRTVSHNLMPKNFAQLGLAKSLEEALNKVSNSDIRFNFIKIGQEVRLDVSTEIQIFRIATELINDVIKHSEATEATLQIVYQPDYLNIILEDNGISENRFEMNNLSSKVGFVNGNLEIDKNINSSTVIVEIPYEPRKQFS